MFLTNLGHLSLTFVDSTAPASTLNTWFVSQMVTKRKTFFRLYEVDSVYSALLKIVDCMHASWNDS